MMFACHLRASRAKNIPTFAYQSYEIYSFSYVLILILSVVRAFRDCTEMEQVFFCYLPI